MTSCHCVTSSRRFVGTVLFRNADYPVTRRHIPEKKAALNHITVATVRLVKNYFIISCKLVYKLFTDAILVVDVVCCPVRAKADTWNALRRMGKEATMTELKAHYCGIIMQND